MLEGVANQSYSDDPWYGNSTGSSSDTWNATLPDREYYDTWYRTVGTLMIGAIFIVGCAGNVMVVLVVWRTRSMHTPTNCHLVSLAAADLILLIWGTLPTLVDYNMAVDEYVLGPVGCSVMVFMQYFGVNVSSLSITALTVERYIAICHPMRAHTVCTLTRAKRILAVIWLGGLTYSAPWLALATTAERHLSDGSVIEVCTYRLPRGHYMIYYLADLVLMYAIPLAVNTTLYGLIARTLYSNTVVDASSFARRRGQPASLPDAAAGSSRSHHQSATASQLLPQRNGKTTTTTGARLVKSTSKVGSRIQVGKIPITL